MAIDEDALERYRVDKADLALPRRLIKLTRACGVHVYFARTAQMWDFYGLGNQPVNEWGNHTELLEDDGTRGSADLHARAAEAPVLTME